MKCGMRFCLKHCHQNYLLKINPQKWQIRGQENIFPLSLAPQLPSSKMGKTEIWKCNKVLPNIIAGKRLKNVSYEILPFRWETLNEVQRGSGIYTKLHESETLQDTEVTRKGRWGPRSEGRKAEPNTRSFYGMDCLNVIGFPPLRKFDKRKGSIVNGISTAWQTLYIHYKKKKPIAHWGTNNVLQF